MKKLCFTTYVYGYYQDFIPTYLYSILHAFKDHYVKIFVEDELTQCNKANLSIIRNEVSDSFEVVDKFDDLVWCQLPHKAGNRFLLTKEYFNGFDYIYFGDVDFIIYNELNDNFYDRYLAHCSSTGLPFSNEWNYDFGKYRMTGLHFVIKDPYFDAMTARIEETKLPTNSFRGQCHHSEEYPSYDEEMLFYMCAHEFNLHPLTGYRRPHHGLHLGTFRTFGPSWSFPVEHHGVDYINEWRRDMSKINEIMKSDLFNYLHKTMSAQPRQIIDYAKFVMSTNMFI